MICQFSDFLNESKNFKINDRVTCIDNLLNYAPGVQSLTIGKEYIVFDANNDHILVINDKSTKLYYRKERFVKYKEYERIKRKKDDIRQKMIDSGLDPYGEDDWLDENISYKKFEIGTTVVVINSPSAVQFEGHFGIVIGFHVSISDSILVKFDEIIAPSDYQHDGYGNAVDENGEHIQEFEQKSRYFYSSEILVSRKKDEYEMLKQKRREEIDKLGLDPYGEDDWLDESISYKKFKIGTTVVVISSDRCPAFINQVGVVIGYYKEIGAILVKFDKIIGQAGHQHSGVLKAVDENGISVVDYEKKSRYFRENHLAPISDLKKYLELKQKRREEIDKLGLDPYGEDDWDENTLY